MVSSRDTHTPKRGYENRIRREETRRTSVLNDFNIIMNKVCDRCTLYPIRMQSQLCAERDAIFRREKKIYCYWLRKNSTSHLRRYYVDIRNEDSGTGMIIRI